MTPPRPCLECGRITTNGTRCPDHYRARQHARNNDPKRRALYAGTHAARSRTARKDQPWCSICGARSDLTWDHQHAQVECRECNSRHRKEPS